MALSLLTTPGFITFARNPAIVKLRADDGVELYDALGVTSKMSYSDSDRFATNETITIEYEEPDGTIETVIFTAKAAPSGDNQFYDASFSGSDSQYWLQVQRAVAQHPRIAPFFKVLLISEMGNKLRVRAKSVLFGWSLTMANSHGFATEDIAVTASTIPYNYRVLLEVYMESSYLGGDYELMAQLEGVPEAGTGFVYFDISGILAAQCRSSRQEPLVPVWATTAPSIADNLRRYYYRFTEESSPPLFTAEWEYVSTRLALDGGVSQSIFADGDFFGGMDDTDSLLSWMTDARSIALEQPEFLAWYNYTGSTVDVHVRVIWYDINDNTTTTIFPLSASQLTVLDKEVALIPIKPSILGLDSEADAYKFTVQVVEDGVGMGVYVAHSQIRTYFIDRRYYESERYIQYLNGFGVPECWRCTGEWGKKIRVDRQVATSPLLPGYNEFASDSFQYERLWSNELTYRTGFLTQGEAEVLQEMLVAGEIYDVSEEGYIPLRVVTDSFQVTETRQKLHSYQFAAMPRLEMKNYSKKKLSSLLSGAWQEPNGEAWFDAFLVPWEL